MNSSINSPKKPSMVVGWILISIAVIISIGSAIFFFIVGNAIGGAIGGGLQGLAALFFLILPYKIIQYGRKRMAKRAEKILDLD